MKVLKLIDLRPEGYTYEPCMDTLPGGTWPFPTGCSVDADNDGCTADQDADGICDDVDDCLHGPGDAACTCLAALTAIPGYTTMSPECSMQNTQACNIMEAICMLYGSPDYDIDN